MSHSYDPLLAATPGTGLDHPHSYWAATAGEAPPDDGPAPATIDTDVAIIGGGYTGLSCAYHLARDHHINAVVLEANRPAWGCSGRNGGFARMALGRLGAEQMVAQWGRPAAKRAFDTMTASLNLVRALIRDGNIACDALEAGHLKIAHRPSRAAALAREAEFMRREYGYPAEYLSAAQLHEQHVGGTQTHGALRVPDAVAVQPLKLGYGVLRMARAAGCAVHRASPVTAWRKQGAQHVLTTPHGTVTARRVVIATNGYTPQHLHPAVTGTLLPVLSHIIVTRPLTSAETAASRFDTHHVLTDTRKLLYYWRRLPDGRIMFGGRGLISDTPQRNHFQRDYLLSELRAKYPGLDDVSVDYDWHGWVCLTRDFLPHISGATDDPSVHYALGYQGSGVAMALHAGRLIAQRIGDPATEVPVPAVARPLPRFPLHSLIRIPQRAMYYWYKFLDNTDVIS